MKKILAALLASVVICGGAQAANTIDNQPAVSAPVVGTDELALWRAGLGGTLGSVKATVTQLYAIAGVGGDCTGVGGPVVSIVCSLAASKVTSGTLAAARLPLPTASTIGGVESKAAVANNYITAIGTDGTVTQARPSTADISDAATMGGIDVSNALRVGSSPSTPTSCGTSPAIASGSTDFNGTVTVGSGTVTACTMPFAGPHNPRLRCQVTASTAIAVGSLPTTTALVVSFGASLGGGSFDYSCQ